MKLWWLIGCLLLCGCAGDTPSAKSRDETVAEQLKPGAIVTLSNTALGSKQPGPVWVFVDEHAADEAAKYAVAKDAVGLKQLNEQGKVIVVDDGTKARVLTTHPAYLRAEVRIANGPHADRSGWAVVPQIIP